MMVHSDLGLNMQILMDELGAYHPKAFLTDDPESKFTQVRLYYPEIEKLSENYLYVADYSNLSLLKDDQIKINFICPNTQNVNSAVKSINLITLDGVLSVNSLFNLIQDIFEKYKLWNQRMLNIILNDCSYDSYHELLNIGAEMLDNPIALFDYSLTLLMHSGALPEGFSERTWEEINNFSYDNIENYSINNKKKMLRDLSQKSAPFLTKTEKYTQLISNLYIEETMVGCLNLIDINKPITAGQIYLANHITNLVEAIIYKIKDSYYYPNHDSIIDKMLKGHYVERKMVQYHLEKINFKLNDAFYIIVYDNLLKDYSALHKAYHYQIQLFFPHSITIPFEEHLVMLIKADNYSPAHLSKFKEFTDFLTSIGVKCGVSLEFNDFLDLKYYFRQAISAIREGKEKGITDPCLFYKEYFTEDLVHSLKKITSLQSYCHPQVVRLNKHDKELSSEYIKTLYIYLLHGRNLTDAAETLNIHRNTLTYRLSKINELLNIDLNDNNQLFHILVSCRLVEFL